MFGQGFADRFFSWKGPNFAVWSIGNFYEKGFKIYWDYHIVAKVFTKQWYKSLVFSTSKFEAYASFVISE